MVRWDTAALVAQRVVGMKIGGEEDRKTVGEVGDGGGGERKVGFIQGSHEASLHRQVARPTFRAFTPELRRRYALWLRGCSPGNLGYSRKLNKCRETSRRIFYV